MQPPYGESGKRIGSISETDPKSANGRNLSNNPTLVVHVQDGNETVILEGSGRREKTSERLNQLRKDYVRKYQYTPDWSNEVESRSFSELNQGSSTPGKFPECTGA